MRSCRLNDNYRTVRLFSEQLFRLSSLNSRLFFEDFVVIWISSYSQLMLEEEEDKEPIRINGLMLNKFWRCFLKFFYFSSLF